MSLGFQGYSRPGTRSLVGFWEPNIGLIQGVQSINSVYVPGVSGSCVVWRYRFNAARTITDVYFFVNTVLFGGPGSLTLNVELRSGTMTAPNLAAPGLLAEIIVTIPTDTGTTWFRAQGFNVAITAGTPVWVCLGDKDFAGGKLPQIQHVVSYVANTHIEFFEDANAATSGDGGQTLANAAAISTLVLRFNDGSMFGWPFPINDPAVVNDTHQRGNRILLATNIQAFGILFEPPASDNITQVNVWQGSSGPSGVPIAIADVPGTLGLYGTNVMLFRTPFIFRTGSPYRITLAYAAPETSPVPKFIGSGSDANLRAAGLFGGDWYSTDASGGAWVDNTNSVRAMALLVEDLLGVAFAPVGPKITPCALEPGGVGDHTVVTVPS